MKLHSGLVLSLRTARSWSQEELTTASGLNIRTVQRIENTNLASLQSRKALASVFQINIKDLEEDEPSVMATYDYKTMEIELKRGFLSGLTKSGFPDLGVLLNVQGNEGWRLVQILAPDLLASWGKSAEKMVAIFERAKLV